MVQTYLLGPCVPREMRRPEKSLWRNYNQNIFCGRKSIFQYKKEKILNQLAFKLENFPKYARRHHMILKDPRTAV